ncbi:hypothetical protein QBC42DRAFT_267638 [Cladorrhinum samala]|uniref:Secreted protein n=1 Tax=Cladorrhinum samala TaxID=585594 RepID=A0AAV9HSC5_9PEZI|nr:hypothetical protein QBC42DRAFT_267638 [Cladorrhinum samala]
MLARGNVKFLRFTCGLSLWASSVVAKPWDAQFTQLLCGGNSFPPLARFVYFATRTVWSQPHSSNAPDDLIGAD